MRPTIPGIENMVRLLALVLGVVAAAGCKSAPPTSPVSYQSLGDPRRENFVIGTADVLRVSVWRAPEASADNVRVRPDGKVTLPLVGEVVAAGKTTDKLKAEIAAALVAYIKEDPQVSVTVVDVNSYQIVVLGNVGRPGVFPLKRYVTVSEAIALSGGLGRYAQDELIIIRTWNRKGQPPLRIPIHFSRIAKGEAPEQDIALYSGDTVYVP
jgi:polysaccharide export outer membrane protein